MKKAGLILLIAFGALIPAAHANRWHGLPEALAWLAPLALLLTRETYARRVGQMVMLAGCFVTVDTMLYFVKMRQAMGQPFTRLAVILTLASLLPLAAAWAMEHPLFRRKGAENGAGGSGDAPCGLQTAPCAGQVPAGPVLAPVAAWALTLTALAAVQIKVRTPMLLAERFWPGAGWLEASALALYAAWVTRAMLDPGRSGALRRRIWGFFSLVFFGQLALGLIGFERFLMSGTLHLPVPALIAAGPLFRGGEGLFMAVLFAVTALLAGPAWCGRLCYIGAWDSAMAFSRKRPAPLPGWVRAARAALAVLALAAAWIMGRAGVPGATAAWLAAGFGLAGVGVMVLVSRRHGVMTHCAGFCPMGLIAGMLGKLSPWRLRMREGCTSCGVCSLSCRYDALRPEDLARRRPGVSCSLCGDCLASCPRSEMELTAFGRGGPAAWAAFTALTASLHAVFLGVARL
jgi:NAD-dependent dihydropyrimidine dehydrogenase PreA subunit